MTVILASSSPRRRELLTRLGVDFKVVPSGVEERPPRAGEDPDAYALELARTKAAEVAAHFPHDTVLAADTVVAVGDEILGKPIDTGDAVRMLLLLAGRTHRVVTGVAVICGGVEHAGTVAAVVRMRPFDLAAAERYVATGEPMDKAGSYAVQGAGGALVAQVTGCYETVVGLPLCLTADLLRSCGISLCVQPPCHH